MAKASEKVGGGHQSSQRRAVRAAKKNTRRLFRRLGKTQGEDAPRKHFYFGYFD